MKYCLVSQSHVESALGLGGGGGKEERDAGLDDGEGGAICTVVYMIQYSVTTEDYSTNASTMVVPTRST